MYYIVHTGQENLCLDINGSSIPSYYQSMFVPTCAQIFRSACYIIYVEV